MSHAIETAAHSLIGSLGEMASIMVSTGDERHAEQLLELRGKLSESLVDGCFLRSLLSGQVDAGESVMRDEPITLKPDSDKCECR